MPFWDKFGCDQKTLISTGTCGDCCGLPDQEIGLQKLTNDASSWPSNPLSRRWKRCIKSAINWFCGPASGNIDSDGASPALSDFGTNANPGGGRRFLIRVAASTSEARVLVWTPYVESAKPAGEPWTIYMICLTRGPTSHSMQVHSQSPQVESFRVLRTEPPKCSTLLPEPWKQRDCWVCFAIGAPLRSPGSAFDCPSAAGIELGAEARFVDPTLKWYSG